MHIAQRLHALDAVRAFALLSGIALHATMSFMPGLAAVGFPADISQSMTLQTVFYVIHVFRMPLFFLIAGFFARQMLERRGVAGFVRDRAKRIVVPLLVGWLVFGPAAMALVYVALGPPIDPGATPQLAGFPLTHLWFLYYLVWLYGIALVVRNLASSLDRERRARACMDRWVRAALRGVFGPALLAAPLAACLYFTPGWVPFSGIASPDTGLTPQWPAMIGFGTAFAFGWLLNPHSDLLSVWRRRWAIYCTLAAALTALAYGIMETAGPAPMTAAIRLGYIACYTLAMWTWVFGLVGAALRFFSSESATRRYLADSSYWLYLAHLPLVFALQLTMRSWPLHWSVKFPLVVGIACAVLLVTYHYLVRNTYIGQILNGRRYGRPRRAFASSDQRLKPVI